ncbi:EscJ/YscJ/HrcJ family type III secretion inner membrane ring protein [Parashewanella spongiae]|uniref:Lipoprotein n=1 Tax=Parashewanella spongiae TaxID=342950 RepID=A0A3A6UMG1_9GAMM|nr:type III secretion inner membrane ring lipoprotein SctJ [Parashewanella spongiae]MCL1076960.1 type III secretion inner membrane ring lipoprotein SctJ [Parashewanella spongiae]RJY18924.1 EscJ/YscJ/HrcJ family type III secretion inner membrane ring protein [Parashewanella spongiae]
MKLRFSILAILLLLLTACKVELYRDLPQDEANHMVALLRLNNIDASNDIDPKTGMATLMIDENKFINAVALLRQNGFPKPKYMSIEDLFPSGQLVTSPAQEDAKISYLKEQQLERTLSNLEGVISARVSIAESTQSDEFQVKEEKSASVYIKYSPQANLTTQENQIKSLIQNAVPGLSYDRITLFIQAANYGYQSAPPVKNDNEWAKLIAKIEYNKVPIVIGLGMLLLLCMFGFFWLRRK